MGVYPEQIVDYLSLVGDSSDNVPGVFGIGGKTAKEIINTFGSLDNLYHELETNPVNPFFKRKNSKKDKTHTCT